mmetsp:Transcript_28923/g.72728  ORF Transcript_28923/g.72728 Transcript_28923/m.72728 type:complete len:449 (-) Transcript_28923:545-1891(-)
MYRRRRWEGKVGVAVAGRRGSDDVCRVRRADAVEGRCRCTRVCAHVHEVQPVAHAQLGQLHILADDVDGVARGAEQSAGAGCLFFQGLPHVVGDVGGGADALQDGRPGGCMVKKDVVERAIHTVRDVVLHELLRLFFLCLPATPGNDVGRQCDRFCREVAAGLGDDAHIREEVVQSLRDRDGQLLEGEGRCVNARPATANVKQLEVEPVHVARHVKHATRHGKSVHIALGRQAAAANVEAQADHFDFELPGVLQQLLRLLLRCTKLGAERHDGMAVVRQDAQDHLRLGVHRLDLVQLALVVKGHHGDALLLCKDDVIDLLAGVGENDVLRGALQGEGQLNLAPAGAVQAGAAQQECLHQVRVGVALDSIERHDAGQQLGPLDVLLNSKPQVHEVERRLVLLLLELLVKEGLDRIARINNQDARNSSSNLDSEFLVLIFFHLGNLRQDH